VAECVWPVLRDCFDTGGGEGRRPAALTEVVARTAVRCSVENRSQAVTASPSGVSQGSVIACGGYAAMWAASLLDSDLTAQAALDDHWRMHLNDSSQRWPACTSGSCEDFPTVSTGPSLWPSL
jgi:hypothetical protein